jgi:hypothetical protein
MYIGHMHVAHSGTLFRRRRLRRMLQIISDVVTYLVDSNNNAQRPYRLEQRWLV